MCKIDTSRLTVSFCFRKVGRSMADRNLSLSDKSMQVSTFCNKYCVSPPLFNVSFRSWMLTEPLYDDAGDGFLLGFFVFFSLEVFNRKLIASY